jgi:chemotaxis-related protein WspD
VLFRVGLEWLALPTALFQEIAALRPIHSLPHRRGGAVLGLGNVRGELIVCLSLAHVLAIEPVPAGGAEGVSRAHQRLLVIQRDGQRIAFPVDEVHGVHRFHRRELQAVPATVARAAAAHTAAVLRWRDHTVGCLDDARLWATLNRSLA